ncbi:hypothetical protein TSOC_004309 [Tetrabaena socialis]|uniref:Uncharacterized protein n=1 Tax=Tetrabaena socialis TaxID=47790 RepID=A0A2J8A992_9CHLO|nr:hypothetical protein TSOC_004309 [Tetrabaena socialis]|eukprot:PNH09089.1 hypothetical protein TSOC_004309 [Tetrabaena socialis]
MITAALATTIPGPAAAHGPGSHHAGSCSSVAATAAGRRPTPLLQAKRGSRSSRPMSSGSPGASAPSPMFTWAEVARQPRPYLPYACAEEERA